MTPIELLKRLHTSDLYLSIACSQRSDKARQRFFEVYGDYLLQVALACSSSQLVAEELVDRVVAYLFTPDGTRELPFAQYDGRISLAGWLALIVKRRSKREEKRFANNCGPVAGFKSVSQSLRFKPESCLSESELGGYLSGLTNAEERHRLKAHLPACEECRQLIAFYKKHKDKLVTILPSELR